MSERGFTIIELLVAAALVLLVAAVLSGLAGGMHRAFDGSVATVDLTARARAGLSAIAADLQEAGSGIGIGTPLQSLADITPAIVPRRSLADAAVAAPFTAVTVTRGTGDLGVLRDRVLAGSVLLQLDPSAPSTRQDGTAGLRAGDFALLLDTNRSESVVVAGVDAAAWTVTLAAPLGQTFEAGTLISGIERTTYGLRRDAAGNNTRLVKRTAAGAEPPLVDYVGAFELSLWGTAEPPRPGAFPDWFPTYGPAAPPLGTDDERDSWPAAENCTLTIDGAGQRLPRLAQSGFAGTLVELTPAVLSDGPWCPDPADAEAFDADLLRLARVDLRLQLDLEPGALASRSTPVSLVTSIALRQR